MTIVVKYGGSVLKDGDSFRRAAEYQRRTSRLALVSAMKDVTTYLGEIFEDKDVQRLLQLKNSYLKVVEGLPSGLHEAAVREIEKDFGREGERGLLHTYLNIGARGAFVGSGEEHSAIFSYYYNKALGTDAEFLIGYDAGFLLDDHGWVDMDSSREPLRAAVKSKIDQGKTVSVGGYTGRHHKTGVVMAGADNINDAFAIAMADASGADSVEIIKDVPAVYHVPPKLGDEFVFGDYGSLKNLSYNETRKMASRGLLVIHPQAALLAQSKNIPIFVKNMESRGTLISADTQTTYEKPFAVLVPRKGFMIAVEDDIMDTPEGRGYWARVAQFEYEHGNDIDITPSDTPVICYTIRLGNIKGRNKEDSQKLLEQHNNELREYLNSIDYNPKIYGEEVGVITAVGDKMKGRPGTLAHLSGILAKENISILADVQSLEKTYTGPSITFAVDLDKLEKSVKVLAEKLFV